jgi:hypothetical protein
MLEGLIWGAHLMSYHDAGNYNNANLGAYVQHQSGVTVGSYYNSERKQSHYGGYTFKPFDQFPRLDVTAGMVSGYSAGRFVPFVLPSLTAYVSDDGTRARLGYVPRVGSFQPVNVVHLMVEKQF